MWKMGDKLENGDIVSDSCGLIGVVNKRLEKWTYHIKFVNGVCGFKQLYDLRKVGNRGLLHKIGKFYA